MPPHLATTGRSRTLEVFDQPTALKSSQENRLRPCGRRTVVSPHHWPCCQGPMHAELRDLEKPADAGPLGARSHASELFLAYDLCPWIRGGWVDWTRTVLPSRHSDMFVEASHLRAPYHEAEPSKRDRCRLRFELKPTILRQLLTAEARAPHTATDVLYPHTQKFLDLQTEVLPGFLKPCMRHVCHPDTAEEHLWLPRGSGSASWPD